MFYTVFKSTVFLSLSKYSQFKARREKNSIHKSNLEVRNSVPFKLTNITYLEASLKKKNQAQQKNFFYQLNLNNFITAQSCSSVFHLNKYASTEVSDDSYNT